MIYMDNAATTRMDGEVVQAMLPYMGYKYANPSGIYEFSKKIKQDISRARAVIAKTIGAKENEIFFTSGGTEADNWALKMTANEKGKGHIITSQIEHHAILKTCKFLEDEGTDVTYIAPDNQGCIDPYDINKSIRNNTFLVSVMLGNNEIGTIQDITQIGAVAKEHEILMHTDAVQAYTNVDIDVNKMNVDMLSVSGHKIKGPKGIGFLYIKEGCLKTPFINGGSQEMGMRAGTENVAGIIGLSKAASIAMENKAVRTGREIVMRNYMIDKVLRGINGAHLNGHKTKRLPNNMNFHFDGVDGATLILMLDQQGICASAGSACSSMSASPSHVLKAIGMSDEAAYSSVRFTINEEISKKEIDYVVYCLKKDIDELRNINN